MFHVSESKASENINPNLKTEVFKEALNEQENEEANDCERWWDVEQDLSQYLKCDFPSCSFEPNVHYKHAVRSRIMSLMEKRIILKYLIITGQIERAKGQKVWEQMHEQGYLTHRSTESLRNCFRRTILPNITTYGLPNKLLKKFQNLMK